MRWKCLLCSACLILACLIGAEARADSEQYIVYLKQKNTLYSKTGEDCGKRYEVVDKKTLSMYLSCDIVEFYEPDYEISLFEDYSARSASGWNLRAVNVQKAWDIGCYGNGVTVAVIDSGVYEHPDIADNLLEGHNYIDNNSDTTDNIGHGTYVSGIIAADMNGEYIDGVASRSKIVPLKCFDREKSTQTSMLSDAIYDAVDIYHADVINMSFGLTEDLTTETFRLAVRYAVQNGCILVAAVGNDGTESVYYPAKYDNVVGVGSVDSSLSVSSFSQHNTTVDAVAPGRGVSSVSIPGYTYNSGTSFAAPHVSAMAAIAKCINKDITAIDFQRILEETSEDLGAEGYDTYFGYGLINIEAMIDKMLENDEVFMSPIDDKGDNVTVTVYNNSNSILNAVGIAAEYEDDIFKDMAVTDMTILPSGTVKMSNKKSKVKFMLWENLITIKPLFKTYIYLSQ